MKSIAANHPETSYSAIQKRRKRLQGGDSNAAFDRLGDGHRIFSPSDEGILADKICTMRDQGVPISESVVRNEAINHFDDLHGAHQTRQNHRVFSDGFVQGFKIRHGF